MKDRHKKLDSERKAKNDPVNMKAGAGVLENLSWLAPVAIALLTLVVFFPVLQNGFVNWDDDRNLLQNPHYRGLGWAQLRWMFTDLSMGHYQPVGWMTFGLDYLLWGMNPFGYHLTSLLLHGANAVIFYFVALRLLSAAFGKPIVAGELPLRITAGCAALFFALHPLRVEPVGWVTERRTVLAGLFFLLSVLCYLRANAVSEGSRERFQWMAAAVTTYGLSLLSKTIGVALPVVLLALDVYPLKRLGGGWREWWGSENRRVWWEKAPFLFLGLAAAAIAPMAALESGAMRGRGEYGILVGIAQPLFGLTFYLWKTVIPLGLSPLYAVVSDAVPATWPILPSQEVILALSVIATLAVTIALFLLRRRWPAGLAAWVCYAALLAPVLGIVQIGAQIVADRYSYLPSLGWALLVGGGLLHCWRTGDGGQAGKRTFTVSSTLAITVLVILGILTWRQAKVWHDSVTLWRHALAIIRESDIVHNNLGNGLYEKGQWAEAIGQLQKALEIDPNHVHYRNNLAKAFVGLGRAQAQRGELDKANESFRRALSMNDSDADTHNNLGIALAMRDKLKEATQHFRQALKLAPERGDIHFNLGNALAKQGSVSEAAERYQEALKIRPDYAEAYNNLGRVTAARGDLAKAIELFRQALRVRPEFAEAHESLALALAQQGKKDEAMRHYQEAQRIMTRSGRAGAARGN